MKSSTGNGIHSFNSQKHAHIWKNIRKKDKGVEIFILNHCSLLFNLLTAENGSELPFQSTYMCRYSFHADIHSTLFLLIIRQYSYINWLKVEFYLQVFLLVFTRWEIDVFDEVYCWKTKLINSCSLNCSFFWKKFKLVQCLLKWRN